MRKTTIECKHCHKSFETGLAPGKMAKCKHCGEKSQVVFQSEVGEETVFDCKNCSEEIRTKTPAGKKVKCPSCKEKVRVPLKDAPMALRALECPGCEAPYETTAKPGQDVECPGCGQKQRIPLEVPLPTFKKAPESDESLAARSVVSRTCPNCGEKVPGLLKDCSGCGIDVDQAIKAARYDGHTDSDAMAEEGAGTRELRKTTEGKAGLLGSAVIAIFGLGISAASFRGGYVYPKWLILGIVVFLAGFVGFCVSLQKRFQGR